MLVHRNKMNNYIFYAIFISLSNGLYPCQMIMAKGDLSSKDLVGFYMEYK